MSDIASAITRPLQPASSTSDIRITLDPRRAPRTLAEHILSTTGDRTLLFQRIALGTVMLAHGAQKVLGWLGGYGFAGTMAFFTGKMHLPSPIAFLVILAESFGAAGLVLGIATRVAASGIAAVMIGAIVTTHLQHGFFMNWFGAQKGEGYEFHLLALALAIPLIVRGPGRVSVDGWLAAHRRMAAARRRALQGRTAFSGGSSDGTHEAARAVGSASQ
jgi:putative oxidoreductase